MEEVLPKLWPDPHRAAYTPTKMAENVAQRSSQVGKSFSIQHINILMPMNDLYHGTEETYFSDWEHGIWPWGSTPRVAEEWLSLWLPPAEKPSWRVGGEDGKLASIVSWIGVWAIFLLVITWKSIQVSPSSPSLEVLTWLLNLCLA